MVNTLLIYDEPSRVYVLLVIRYWLLALDD
jgi:hypothetical protein